MKAILRLGSFSTMMDVPDDRRKIHIPDPTHTLVIDYEKLPPEPSVAEKIHILVFEFKTYLDKDIALYIFTGKE